MRVIKVRRQRQFISVAESIEFLCACTPFLEKRKYNNFSEKKRYFCTDLVLGKVLKQLFISNVNTDIFGKRCTYN